MLPSAIDVQRSTVAEGRMLLHASDLADVNASDSSWRVASPDGLVHVVGREPALVVHQDLVVAGEDMVRP